MESKKKSKIINMESLNIFSNIKGKYFYKSVRLIVFYVILPILVIITWLFIFQTEKLIKFLEAINL